MMDSTSDKPERHYRIVIDTKDKRPACVLIQAAFGCDDGAVQRLFHCESWLLHPTPNMAIVHGTKSDWEKFAAKVNRRFPMRGPLASPAAPRRLG